MGLNVGARQETGAPLRQLEDGTQDSGSFRAGVRLSDSVFEENLNHFRLPKLSLEAVRGAAPSAELCEQAPGEPVLRHAGKLLGGDPNDASLARTVKEGGDNPYIVFGIGLGHTLRALRSLTSAPIVVFEPDPGILRALFELGPCDLSGFDIICNSHDLTQIWPTIFGGRQTATLVNTPGYIDAFPEAAADLRKTLGELVQRSRINHETHRVRAREWVSDMLANVELLREHPGFLALAGKYRGVPAFIVGAGPSLGKNGADLVQATQKGIVFAVNSSARALDRLGVVPQVLACMESIDVSHLLKSVSFIDDVIRAFTLSAHPTTLRTGEGPLLPIWEGIAQLSQPLQELTGYPGIPVSGSVSTIAFALAQRLGCSPIVLVGQDLAYTGGLAYAAGTPYEESRVSVSSDGRSIQMAWCDTLKNTHNVTGRSMHESEPLNEISAWGGDGKVLTSIGFAAVRGWFESAAIVLGLESPETRLVNATEGGGQIQGFEELSLSELLKDLEARDITSASMRRDALSLGRLLSSAEIAAWADRQAEAVQKARHAARRVRRLADISLSASQRGDPIVTARLSRLDAAERELSRFVAAAPLLDAWSWGDVDRVMQSNGTPVADAREAAETSLAFEARFGSTIDRSARELEHELRQLSRRLRVPVTGN